MHAIAADKTAAEKPSADKPATSRDSPKWKKVNSQKPAGVKIHPKLVCATYGDRKITLDLYVPDAPAKCPAILFIHGGGWSKGTIDDDKPLAERLAVRGFVCGLVDYRLSGEAKYPAALHDCKAAVRFLRASAAKYKIDVDHVGVIGGSAGGHLSGLLAMTNDEPAFEGNGGNAEVSSRVQACVVMAASMDLVAADRDNTPMSAVQFFGSKYADNPAIFEQASPISHVSKSSPPTLFIEGEKDTEKIGRPQMQEKLKSAGVETTVITLKDAPHPFWMSQPWLDEAADQATAFFTKYLGEPKK